MTDEEKKKLKDALFDLIEECRSGGASVDESASNRLIAASQAATVLLVI